MEKKIYATIAKVAGTLAEQGIAKDNKNQQQGYNFRGIDDVYNALAPLLARNGLVILPRVIDRSVTERTTAKGGLLFYTTLTMDFDFVCAEDGSMHTVRTIGEAMDSGDKSSNKAMSAAYKYACMQAFCIPTEGDNDADAHTHEIVAKKPAVKPMDDSEVDACKWAMLECDGLEALKSIFGAAYTRANADQKKQLQTAYEQAKTNLTKEAA